MKIDTKTGQVIFEDKAFNVTPAYTKSDFMQIAEIMKASLITKNPPWSSFQIEICDKPCRFLAVVVFKDNNLFELRLSCATGQTSWSLTSEVEELAKKKQHDKLLAECLGSPPYHFQWGTVVSCFDQHGQTSEIIIRYAGSKK